MVLGKKSHQQQGKKTKQENESQENKDET